MMKRMVPALLFLVTISLLFSGCQSNNRIAATEGKIHVVTSFFPLYDFAATIGGSRVSVLNLVPTGVEPHDWAPKSQDMMNIAKAQLFIYQGAGFEGWTSEVLDGIDTRAMIIVEGSKGIDLIDVQSEPDEHHGDGDEHGHEEGHEDEDEHEHGTLDPHTWLSPKSALKMAENILIGLQAADPEHTAVYEQNFQGLRQQLETLDLKFTEQLGGASKKEIVVSHQAFGYLARDYNLLQMPLMGISAEAESTAQQLKEISKFIKEHQIKYIFTEQLASDSLAKTLAKDLGVSTMPLHTLEGLTKAEANRGETYITLMEKNLANLMTALQ